jgi:hypothetical protein
MKYDMDILEASPLSAVTNSPGHIAWLPLEDHPHHQSCGGG